jgi:hypothetical protein
MLNEMTVRLDTGKTIFDASRTQHSIMGMPSRLIVHKG